MVARLVQSSELMPLAAGEPNHVARDALGGLDANGLFAHASIRDRHMAEACLAGLWLLHGFLDESHGLSQRNPTVEGSYWHGIMHRREGDFSNAKYWFRRVGIHTVHPRLAATAREMAAGRGDGAKLLAAVSPWDSGAFVDLCRRAVEVGGAEEELCRQVQQREWALLFDHCYRAAVEV
jgi:hypothetical protein